MCAGPLNTTPHSLYPLWYSSPNIQCYTWPSPSAQDSSNFLGTFHFLTCTKNCIAIRVHQGESGVDSFHFRKQLTFVYFKSLPHICRNSLLQHSMLTARCRFLRTIRMRIFCFRITDVLSEKSSSQGLPRRPSKPSYDIIPLRQPSFEKCIFGVCRISRFSEQL